MRIGRFQLERGEIDLLIGSERMVPGDMKARVLFHEHYVMAQRKRHPRGRKPLDLGTFCNLSHILVSTSGGSFRGDIDQQLEKIGRRRNIVLSIHQFMLAPMLLGATDYVATLPAQFANHFADKLDTFELPFKARGFTLSAAWHPRDQADAGHVWLRNQLSALAADHKAGV